MAIVVVIIVGVAVIAVITLMLAVIVLVLAVVVPVLAVVVPVLAELVLDYLVSVVLVVLGDPPVVLMLAVVVLVAFVLVKDADLLVVAAVVVFVVARGKDRPNKHHRRHEQRCQKQRKTLHHLLDSLTYPKALFILYGREPSVVRTILEVSVLRCSSGSPPLVGVSSGDCMPTPEGAVLAQLLLAPAWLLGAESPKHIFLSSGTRRDSYPLGTGAPLLWVFLGCSRSSAPRLGGGGSGELLTAGTPLERVRRAHGHCSTPHQRHPRRSTMLLAPERW